MKSEKEDGMRRQEDAASLREQAILLHEQSVFLRELSIRVRTQCRSWLKHSSVMQKGRGNGGMLPSHPGISAFDDATPTPSFLSL